MLPAEGKLKVGRNKVLILLYLTVPFASSLICITFWQAYQVSFPKVEIFQKKIISSSTLLHYFPFNMASLRNQKKWATRS